MKIGLAAVDMQIVSKEARRQDIARFIDEAADAGCEMVFFPEYVNCQRTSEAVADWDAGRENQVFLLHAEPVPDGPAAKVIADKCRQRRIWCAAGINEKCSDGKVINAYLVFDPQGRVTDRHVKTQLPPCEEGLTPGDEAGLLCTPLGRLGTFTCWEIHYPELGRLYQILGADLLVFPTAQNDAFALEIARVRAHETNRPMLALAYVWPEKPEGERPMGVGYIDEKGTVMAKANDRRQLLVVDVPVRKGVNDIRFETRRPHVYRRIVEPIERSPS